MTNPQKRAASIAAGRGDPDAPAPVAIPRRLEALVERLESCVPKAPTHALWLSAAQNAIAGRNVLTADDLAKLVERGETLAKDFTPATVPPAPSLDAEGKLAEWPPRDSAAGLYAADYDAPRPHWLVLQNALSRMPYSGGLGTPLRRGQTVDEAFASLANYVDRLAETLRGVATRSTVAEAELNKYRGVLRAELDREELLEGLRQARGQTARVE